MMQLKKDTTFKINKRTSQKLFHLKRNSLKSQ